MDTDTRNISEQIKSVTGTIHVVGQYDCDGIASSGIISHALKREEKEYNLSLISKLTVSVIDNLNKCGPELFIFTDLGLGQMNLLSRLNFPAIVIDHHLSDGDVPDNITEYNLNYEINGSFEACSSSLAFSIAKVMSNDNADLAPFAIAGLIGDRQHFGGLKGLNKELIDKAIKDGYIRIDNTPSLLGENIGRAISNSVDPYFVGFSGRIANVNKQLKKMNINPQSNMNDLDDISIMHLITWIKNRLETQTNYKGHIIETVTNRFWLNEWDMDASKFHWLLDSSGRYLDKQTCVGVVNGNKKSMRLANKYFANVRDSVMDILNKIESQIIELNNVQYFKCIDSKYKGLACGFAMDWFLNPSKPVFGFAVHDNQIEISARGTELQVKSGLNLSETVRIAAHELGGSGGGHAIAAGGRIPYSRLNQFLDIVDKIIDQQFDNKIQ